MEMSNLAQLVNRTRSGDSRCFEALVARFQDMAVGYAFARLGDHASAQDVAQEAFTDAFLHLDQLRDDAAFPGWFRRVLHKHCDRVTRRRLPDEAALRDGGPAPNEPTERLERRRQANWLRTAIEALPEHERIVVAMHYLGDTPQAEVAVFLELPLTTVKKRLHTARRRLDPSLEKAATPASLCPSSTEDFGQRIQLFLAIRAADQAAVTRILDSAPELVHSEERWSDQEAFAGGFPLAHHQPPLVLAARSRDASMTKFLLSRGAKVNARCGCAGQESALWVAVRAGDITTVNVLLAAGADPNVTNATGLTALHVAAMRGRADLVARLLEHNADPTRTTHDGMLATDWAQTHGHHEVLELLERPAAPNAAPPNAAAPQTQPATTRLETGIKALDLWVPMTKGSIIRVHGAAETGLMVLLSELVCRFAKRGGASVWAGWELQAWHSNELDTVAAEAGIETLVHIVKTTCGEPSERQHGVVERALEATAVLARTHDPVALFVFEEPGHRAQIEAALPRLAEHAHVVFVVQPWTEVTQGKLALPTLGTPYTGIICTDPALAKRGLYPAISPQQSRSQTASEMPPLAHVARELLSTQSTQPKAALRRALLEAFLTEPFTVAEQHTGWPAASLPLTQTLAGVQRILAGELDAFAPDLLRYRSALPRSVDQWEARAALGT